MELNFKKYGDSGEHIIILHGLFGMLDNWHTLASRFSAQYQVWIVDQRNHGRSPHSVEFNYPVMADDLHDFFQQHSIPKAHLIGHSMGGKTVMQFAFQYPDLIAKLIVIDIAPIGYPVKHNNEIEAMQSVQLDKITRRSDAEEMLMPLVPENDVRQFLLKNLTREGDTYRWRMDLESIVKNYAAIIGPVDLDKVYNGATLFIKGGNSDYIREEDKPEILRQFPKAEFITVPGVGHWVHAEAPGHIFDIVTEYFQEG